MNDYTTDNLLFLRKEYKTIYDLVRNRERDEHRVQRSVSKSGHPNVLVQQDGVSKAMYSRYNPLNEAERWANQLPDHVQEAKHILIFGLGLGYHLEQLIRQYPDKRFYVYEPELEIFLAYMEARKLEPAFKHATIHTLGIGTERAVMNQFLQLVVQQIDESFAYVSIPWYQTRAADQEQAFVELFQHVILQHRGDLATFVTFQEKWAENALLNMAKNLESSPVYVLKDALSGYPAVIVGSGPSLELDLELLKTLKDRALIIAAGSSIQALLHHGIRPHLIVSMDGGEANVSVFEDLELSDIPFVYAPFIHYKIIEKVRGPLYHLVLNVDTISTYLLGLKEKDRRFYSTSSVSGTAIQLALYLGCQQVLLTGQDLSYPNDTFYSTGVDHIDDEHLQKSIEEAEDWIPNVQGGKNRISKKMLNTLRDIEELIAIHAEGVEYINCSQRGAIIQGTTYMPMHEFFARTPAPATEGQTIEEILQAKYTPYHQAFKRKVEKRIHDSRAEIEQIGYKLHRLKKEVSRLEEMLKVQKVEAVQRSITKIDSQWQAITRLKTFEHIYFHLLQAQISIYLRVLPSITQEKDTLKKGQLIVKHLGPLVGPADRRNAEAGKLVYAVNRQNRF